MNLTKTQQRTLDSVWRAFDERNVRYVVLRGYENLPESVEGSDVDMLVDDDSFDEAITYCEQEFESTESILQNAFDLTSLASRHPKTVIRRVSASPTEVLSEVKQRLVSTEVSLRRYVSRVFDADGLQLHLVNHLAYKSPMDGNRIRVDPVVERLMFERRNEAGAFYVPASPDRLAHLVCRGVFDYSGEFPSRYVSHCDALVEEIRSNSVWDEQFQDVLSHIFYDADELVYEFVMSGDYDAIYTELRRYSDY